MNSNSFQKRIYITALVFIMLSILFVENSGGYKCAFSFIHFIIPFFVVIIVLHIDYNDLLLFIKNIMVKTISDLKFMICVFNIFLLLSFLILNTTACSTVFGSSLFLISSFSYLLIHSFVATHSIKNEYRGLSRILITKFSTRLIEIFFVFISMFLVIITSNSELIFTVPIFILFFIESFLIFELGEKEINVLGFSFNKLLPVNESAMLFLSSLLIKLMFISFIFYRLIPVIHSFYVNQLLLFCITIFHSIVSKRLYSIKSRFVFRKNILIIILLNLFLYAILKFMEIL